MFYLHVSNRTENLLRQLAELIRVDKQPHPFSPELLLIQSQGMERMIAQNLADEFTSFCNFHFYLPLDFLKSIGDKLGLGVTPDGFTRQTLTFRIDQLLRDIESDVYSQIRSYLEGSRKELKRYQLARRLSNVFDQYQLMRIEMLDMWEQGRLATQNSSEPWQMDLWQRLITQPDGGIHRGTLLRSVIDTLEDKQQLSASLAKRISVVGLHTLPPLLLRFLNALAKHMDVHFYLLSPCREYWGDVESKRQLFKKRLVSGLSPFEEDEKEHHPLLAGLGRQGRDLQAMMLEGAEFALEFESYDAAPEKGEYVELPLLQKVQADLLEGRLEKSEKKITIKDDSIRVVSCHSKLRELTVLREHLLHFLHSDISLEHRDIIVMAPDIQEYAPLIPAVFSSIQHSIADRSVRRKNSVFSAFLGFLDLFKGRFGWNEVLDTLHQPSIHTQFELSLSDIEQLESWVINSGIRWGLSAEQREKSGLAFFAENSWKAGLERLLMGYGCDADTFVDGVLPYSEIEGRNAQALGGLCRYIDLLDKARIEVETTRDLAGWSELLGDYIAQLFGENDYPELLELRSMVDDLGISMEGFAGPEISFEVIHEWFEQSAKESRSSSGFLRGQLTFCSMLPMRSIPFKVVCLLGLNDGVYPQPDNHDNFDLMGQGGKVRLGDRSPRADDRYQFLEAILAAREKLYVSYIGQSVQDNEKIPPSVVVTELLEVLEDYYGVKDVTVHHPLHSFSSKYFLSDEDSDFISYDNESCRVARRLRAKTPEPALWWQGVLGAPEKSVEVERLLQFFFNPQKHFVRHCLGLQLAALEERVEDKETFALQGLNAYLAQKNLIEQQLQQGDNGETATTELLQKMQAGADWPLGRSGELQYYLQNHEAEQFVDKVHGLKMGKMINPLQFDSTVNGFNLLGTLDNVYENGVLVLRLGKIRGKDLLSAWLHHQLALLHLGDSYKKTCLVTKERVVTFTNETSGPSLDRLLQVYHEGLKEPSPLYVEPAFVYAKQCLGRGRLDPRDKAEAALIEAVEKGYEPEWQMLLQGCNKENILAPEFEEVAEEVMIPLVEAANG